MLYLTIKYLNTIYLEDEMTAFKKMFYDTKQEDNQLTPELVRYIMISC